MYTYQDFLLVPDNEEERMAFVKRAIDQHKTTELYKTAIIADEYDRHRNRTIMEYQKILYDVLGRAVPDVWTANYKLASRFFNRFVTQENQYLLGNGVTWTNDATKERLGDDFDTQLQKAGKKALVGGVSFGFFNMDHMDVFGVDEFVPLYDEENGAMMAGIRFWQVDRQKPLRATLYEIDGYTDYIWNRREIEDGSYVYESSVLHEKRPYIEKIRVSEADGEEIYDGENYPTFPIVPLWGNPHKQSEIVGLREQIDCYDLIKSGYANNVDEASIIYWTLQNAGGMDDIDLAQFVEKMRKVHAAQTDDDVHAEAKTMDAPYASREALLATLRADLYEDAMALDTKNIAGGATTATQIKAAYEPLNSKCDEYEYCVVEFLRGILEIIGLDDQPTFTRSIIVNGQEELQLVLQSAQYLEQEYVTKKILTLLGDGDQAEEILEKIAANELEMAQQQEETEEVEEEEEDTALADYGNEVMDMLQGLLDEFGGEE